MIIPQFLLWLFFNQCIVAQTDCHWLRIIYQKMGGNVRWIPEDCRRMDEIICTDGLVTQIRWINQDLIGSIPSEIGNLVNLQVMYQLCNLLI